MQRTQKLISAKIAAIAAVIPILLWAHEYGPDPGYCGVPKENASCIASQCHVGTANDPANKGSVSISFPAGNIYIPGIKQHLVVTVADPAATQRAWGFQLTSRLASNSATMAGTLASTDEKTTMLCGSTNLFQQVELPYAAGKTQTCPNNAPLSYVEHSLAGYDANRGTTGGYSFDLEWTPPATANGNVDFYIAGNAANGDLSPNGDHIYTNKFTLTPAVVKTPSISAGGVISAGAFGAFPTVAPGSWMEIFGAGMFPGPRSWLAADFIGTKAPTSLDGVKVTIGGKAAFLDFVSEGQINAQVPSDTPTGAQQMTVTNTAGTSNAYNITVNALRPGLLAPGSFSIGGKQYVVAQFLDGGFVLPPNTFPGTNTRQVKPGEMVVIYGVGFGPALDANNQEVPAGTIAPSSSQLAKSFNVSIGGVPATFVYKGLAPGFVGLYQFNVNVPAIPNNDFAPVTFTLDGAPGPQTLYLAVKQ